MKKQAAMLAYQGNIDADAPFIVRPLLPDNVPRTTPASRIPTPPLVILRARLQAYQQNSEALKALAEALKGKSSALEEKCRKVVARCTGVEENRVDTLLEGLVTAVESDGHVEDLSLLEGFVQAVNQS